MSFVRPEARAALWRWREVLTALSVLALGLWWALATGGILRWLGYALIAIALVLLAAGTQRVRFRVARQGPGAVRVDEGQVAYFGPLTGGAVALSELSELSLDPRGTPHWVLRQPGQPDLHIPLTADGADDLFDAFASLPGIRTERMLAQMRRHPDHPVVIWQAPRRRLH